MFTNNLEVSSFPGGQLVKSLPAMLETQAHSLGTEDPLEKEMATHASILAWRIPQTEEPSGLQSTVSQRVGHDWGTNTTNLLDIRCVAELMGCYSPEKKLSGFLSANNPQENDAKTIRQWHPLAEKPKKQKWIMTNGKNV